LLISPVKANILIDQSGHARLADFGLLTIITDPTNPFASSSYTQGGTARWMSPELIDPQRFGLKGSRPTRSSDCYALGMVIYETISGNLPFHEHTDLTVFVKVLEGRASSPRGEVQGGPVEDARTVLGVSTEQPSDHRKCSPVFGATERNPATTSGLITDHFFFFFFF
jgi:serine/threonine protein kinase